MGDNVVRNLIMEFEMPTEEILPVMGRGTPLVGDDDDCQILGDYSSHLSVILIVSGNDILSVIIYISRKNSENIVTFMMCRGH